MPPPAYVGTPTCGLCHPAALAVWTASAHASAHSTLNAALHGADPECLACHTTGFRVPGGWTGSATPDLDDVGCEACHGPGGAHAASPDRSYGIDLQIADCVACHTRDNSPDFVKSAYWGKVAHGR